MPARLDLSRLQKAKPIAGGAVSVPAYLTSVGIFEYRDAAGTVTRELRHPDEVFSVASLDTLRNATVTDLHPSEMVNASNWKKHAIGSVAGGVKRDGNFVAGELVINESTSIGRIDNGERGELSCGYDCELDYTPGEINGRHYDAIQRNIRYNHVAIGPENWGRAGGDVALRLDSGAAFAQFETKQPRPGPKPEPRTTVTMKRRFTIDSVSFEVDADEGFFQALSRNFDSAKATIVGLTTERDGEKKRADEEKARADAETVKVADKEKHFDSKVAGQLKLRKDATTILPADYSYDGKAERDVMVDAITVKDKTFDAKDQSDDYIRARFDMIVSQNAEHQSSDSRNHLDVNFKGGDDSPLAKAQDSYVKVRTDGWTQPLAATQG